MGGAGWQQRANQLAKWTWKHLVVRTDVWGQYLSPGAERDRLDTKSLTKPNTKMRGRVSLQEEIVERHYRGESQGDLIGLHFISPENVGRSVAWDIDAHAESDDAAVNEAGVIAMAAFLSEQGFESLTYESAPGGFHVRVLFDAAVPSDVLYFWAKQIADQWHRFGLAVRPEQFPKQSSLSSGQFGNWLRLPGRHHTQEHWSRVWDGESWLEDDAAIDAILATTLNKAPAVEVPPAPPAEPDIEDVYGSDELVEAAKKCLTVIDPDIGYEEWFRVGLVLHRLMGADGLAAWDVWSASGSKYKPGECDKRWQTINGASVRKVGISTLLRLAKEAGHEIKLPPPAEALTAWQISPPAGVVSTADDTTREVPTTEVKHLGPLPIQYSDSGPRPLITNVEDYQRISAGGRETAATRHIPLPQIARSIWAATGGWPIRASGILFVAEHSENPIPDRSQVTFYSKEPAQLFAWLGHVGDVRWTEKESESTSTIGKTLNPPSKKEMFYYLRDRCMNFRAVECLPHHPPLRDVYYLPHSLPAIPPGGISPLEELVRRLNCDTEEDRLLMLAALITPGWGGPAGTRPAFVFTSEHGRGSGKSATASVFSRVWGGAMTITAGEDWQKIRGRLLGDEALTARVAMIDNMKGRKNDQDLEAIITCTTIDGWKPYHGDARRPNLLTWYLTSNSPSVSNDLAERSVVIRLGPQKHEKDFVGWAEQHVDKYRAEILSEIFSLLSGEKKSVINVHDRWVAWRNAILSLFPNGNDLATTIIGRRSEVDADREDAETLAEAIKNSILKAGFDPRIDNVFFTSSQMFHEMKRANAIGAEIGVKGAVTYVKERCGIGDLSPLRWKRMNFGRGFAWTGNPNNNRWNQMPENPSDTYGWSNKDE